MAPERRKLLLLAVLLVAVVAIVLYRSSGPPSVAASRASTGVKGQRAAAGGEAVTAPDVHLEALGAERVKPDDVERNLFRFQPRPVARAAAPPRAAAPAPVFSGPPPPPATSTITLKFVGLLETNGERIASLSDGRGITLGKEGEIVLGRYKIWRIGADSIDLSYVDGTGRTTIRLTGQ